MVGILLIDGNEHGRFQAAMSFVDPAGRLFNVVD